MTSRYTPNTLPRSARKSNFISQTVAGKSSVSCKCGSSTLSLRSLSVITLARVVLLHSSPDFSWYKAENDETIYLRGWTENCSRGNARLASPLNSYGWNYLRKPIPIWWVPIQYHERKRRKLTEISFRKYEHRVSGIWTWSPRLVL